MRSTLEFSSDRGPAGSTPAFFVVGCPRSGTTLLSVVLDRHSRLCVPPETGFYQELAPGLAPGTNDELLHLLRRWRRLPELGLTPEDVMNHLGTSPRTRGDVLAALLALYARSRSKPVFGEKTPQHLFHVPDILRDFPEARIFCIVRDGRDNALSLNAMPWWRGTLRSAARLWVKCAALASRFQADYPDRFFIVRYEALLHSPFGTLAPVMKQLGERFEADQLDPTIPSDVVLPRSLEWKGSALLSIEADRAGRRLRQATTRQVAVVEKITSKELEPFGYDALHPTPARLENFVPRRLQSMLGDLPARLASLPADLLDSAVRRPTRMPPRRLRYNAAGTSSRRAFATVGLRIARAIAAAVSAVDPQWERQHSGGPTRVLDFACGCGRVAAPLQTLWPKIDLLGVDTDASAVAWCRENLRGEFHVTEPGAPLPFPGQTMQMAYAINVLTHMTEARQFELLREVHRVLAPASLFVVTTRSPELVSMYPELPEPQRESLRDRGFAFVCTGTRFNDNITFHSIAYLRSAWSPWFEVLAHTPYGTGSRDLTILRRKERR